MQALRRYRLFFFVMSILAGFGMIAGSFWDLPLSKAVYQNNQPLCVFLEAVCFFPIYFPLVLLFSTISFYLPKTWLKFFFELLGTLTFFSIIFVGLTYVGKRNIHPFNLLFFRLIVSLLFSLFMEYLLLKLLKRLKQTTFQVLICIAILGSLYLIWELALVQSLKALAGRPRYEDLLNGLGIFSPWYQFSRQGGSSFPSGHTAASCGIFLFLFVPLFIQRFKKLQTAFSLGTALYVGLSAFSRIVVGKHFLSDTCFSILVMLLGLTLLMLFWEQILLPLLKKYPFFNELTITKKGV